MADHLNALAVTAVLQYFVILIACRMLLQLYIDGLDFLKLDANAIYSALDSRVIA